MRRRIRGFMIIAAAVMLAACASNKEVREEKTATAGEASEKAGEKPVNANLSLSEGNSDKESSASEEERGEEPKGKLMIAAAASLEKILTEEIIPEFNKKYPDIEITGTYDSSGKLQTQIEEGAGADIFFSASTKQMNALDEEGLMESDSIVKLLENKIVLIVPAGDEEKFEHFEDIVNADMIAIGDPESVPAGQYARESLENLGLWTGVESKASLGSNVTEVLNWVAESSAQAGIVYATDAMKLKDRVSIIEAAPEGSVKPATYPAGITKACEDKEAARKFMEFLAADEIKNIFVKSGFEIVNE